MMRAHFRDIDSNITNRLSSSNCLVPISIGQKFHEGIYFDALFNLINDHFKACHLLVCDSLYRHTIKLTNAISDADSHHQANQKGEEWLSRNTNAIKKIKIPFTLSRWDDWSQIMNPYFDELNYLYKNNDRVKSAFDESADEFLLRYSRMNAVKLDQRTHSICLNYLLEECATTLAIHKYQKYDFLTYPSHPVSAITATLNHYLGESEQIIWLRPRFTQVKQVIERLV